MNTYTLWSERYQPTCLDECILEGFQKHVQFNLKKYAKAEAFPNLLLYGIAGTGKSTIARLLCDEQKYQVIWRNGSLLKKEDIPDLVKEASSRNIYGTHKIVFIDEADGISLPAQQALRSAIDPRVSASWILTCNYRKKLLEPIASRFMQIECSLPSAQDKPAHISGIVRRCQQILKSEKIDSVSDAEIEAIVSEKYPDIRQTIIELQQRYEYLSETV